MSRVGANSQRLNTPPEQWPINTYWNQSEERISQHWYICFCLMMSAVQDYLTGLFLYKKDNLNWAITCFYYSMVHTGRLIAFCITGNYPTQHFSLRMLYHNQSIPLNWLNQFIENRTIQNTTVNDFLQRASEFLETLGDSDKTSEKLNTFSEQLYRLAELRTDANYESLLIAHEKYHIKVTEGFERLVKAAESAAANAISLAISSYRAYIFGSLLLNGRRETFKSLSNQYVSGRFIISLTDKLRDCKFAIIELDKLEKKLCFEEINRIDTLEVCDAAEQQIQMEYFESKQSLMNKFLRKISSLENVLEMERNEQK